MDFSEMEGSQSPPLIVKDSDGQEIRLSMSIQYKLDKDNVGKLYNEFQKGYEVTFVSYIDSVVRKIVGNFDSTAFWKDRKGSGEKIRAAIDEKLKDVYATCRDLQVLNI
jgi:hypothetical protein